MVNLKGFVNSLKAERLSEMTIKNYGYEVELMLRNIGKPANEIRYADIIDWLGGISDMSAATVNKRINAAKKFFTYLTNIGVISENPMDNITLVKSEQKEALYVPFDEAKILIKYGKNARDKAIIAVFLSTGLRFSEVANLTLDDYDSEKIMVKTKGNKLRAIWLNDTCRHYVDEYLKVRKNTEIKNLFVSNQGTPMKNASLNKTLKVIAERAGITNEIHIHSLRHSVTSELCHNYGINEASKIIGHSNIRTTARYCHDKDEDIKNAMLSITL